MHSQQHRSWLMRYGIAVGAVLLAFAARALLSPLLGDQAPLLVFTFAVMGSAWYGGLGPGLLSTTLAAVTAHYFFIEPYSPSGTNVIGVTHLFLFVVIGTGISLLCHNLRESQLRAEAGALEASRHHEILRQSEERYRMLFNAIDEGFCIIEMLFDQNGKPKDYRFLEINPAFEKQTGIQHAEGKRMREIAPLHEEHWFEIYGNVALAGKPVRFQNEARELNRWFDVYAFRVGDEASPRVGVLFSDITERKEIQTALVESLAREQTARADAEQANRLKDEFLASVSHELRTPLSAIVGWAALLRIKALEPAAVTNALEVIERNARAQEKLIDDLMDVSRIITGKLHIDLHAVDLLPVVESAIDSVRPSIEAKGIQLHRFFDRSLGPVSGDATRLQQIIWNLLSNAVKFTPQGGRIEVRLTRMDSQVEIAVVDTGKGIAAEFLPHVFDRFSQADTGHARVQGGLGLGLAIVRYLVELHGGTVRVDSAGPGQGAVFTVQLPLMGNHLLSNKEPYLMEKSSGGLECPPELAGLSILIVDDDLDVRQLLAAVLEQCGARVTSVSSSAEAIAVLDSGALPDVLLSDLGMPQEDGYTLIRKVRARRPEHGGRIPAAALTAYSGSQDRQRALRAGYHIHVVKPIEPSELVAVVASLAGRMEKSA
jgi:PAS domain S-box-containing protein